MKHILANLVILLSLMWGTTLIAQEDAPVSVIAVGEAGLEKPKVTFMPAEINGGLSSAGQKQLQEFTALLKSNFAFYGHLLESVEGEGQKAYSQTDWVTWSTKSSGFVVGILAEESAGKLKLSAAVHAINQKKTLGTSSVEISGSDLREKGHRLADSIYHMITGKHSIFTAKIVFVSDRSTMGKDTRKELYVMDFDGRRVERLTFFDSTVISPAISPDNSKVMFSVIQSRRASSRKKGQIMETKNIDLQMLDLRTKKFTPVSGRPGINSGAIFSSDGKKIYYTMTISGNADIYEMDLASGKTRKITSHYADDVDPSITAEGNLMSFLSNRAGRAHIYIADPNGTEKDVRRISFVGQFNATPRFSPTGKEIVFVSWVDNNFDLYRIDAQGSNLARLTKDFGSNEEPSYSPDGEFIIFTSQRVLSRKEATQDIYIMNREGEILGRLTQDFGRCFSPRWSN